MGSLYTYNGNLLIRDGKLAIAPACCCGGGVCCRGDCTLLPCKPCYLVITASEEPPPTDDRYGYASYTSEITWDGCEAVGTVWDDSGYDGQSMKFGVRIRRKCDSVDICGTCARNCTFTIEYSRGGTGYKSTLAETLHPRPGILASATIKYGADGSGDTGGIKVLTCDSTKSGDTCAAAGGTMATGTCDTPNICGTCDCPSNDILHALHFSITYSLSGLSGTLTQADFTWIGASATKEIYGSGFANFQISCVGGVLRLKISRTGSFGGGCPGGCTSATQQFDIPCSLTDRTWMAVSRSFTLAFPDGVDCSACPALTATWTVTYPC